jgi:protein-disulfide isomerase
MRRYYYRPLLLAFLCAPLFWGAASATDTRSVTIGPPLARGAADAPVTIVEFSDYQ